MCSCWFWGIEMGVLNVEEELDKECNELFHFYQDKILKLEEEKEQFKQQFEQMKNCLNCKFGDLGEDNIWCYNKERSGFYDAKKGCKHWELAE